MEKWTSAKNEMRGCAGCHTLASRARQDNDLDDAYCENYADRIETRNPLRMKFTQASSLPMCSGTVRPFCRNNPSAQPGCWQTLRLLCPRLWRPSGWAARAAPRGELLLSDRVTLPRDGRHVDGS